MFGDWFGNNERTEFLRMNFDLMRQLETIQYVKYGICLLFAVLVILMFMHLFHVRSLLKSKGLKRSTSRITSDRSKDKQIVAMNKFIRMITNFIEKSPFKMAENSRDFMQYNLNRGNVKVPGGYRYMQAEEFAALNTAALGVSMIVVIAIGIIVNPIVGVLIGTIILFVGSTLPMIMLRANVRAKDDEINKEFPDFYLMLHYTLLNGAKTPIDKLMKSYSKATNSEELKRFIDVSVGHIESYSEFSAMSHIARDYREIAYINKLCRLIKQLYSRADVENELIGFRAELLNDKKYRMDKEKNKLIAKAQASFNILMLILIQAIMSSMAIYIPDLMGAGSFI